MSRPDIAPVNRSLLGPGVGSSVSKEALEARSSAMLTRKTPGEFSPEVIELLKTFATQSALAIQNARLFREIADKSRQLARPLRAGRTGGYVARGRSAPV